MNAENFKKKQRVIFADGVYGEVRHIEENYASIRTEDGEVAEVWYDEPQLERFYLLGGEVIGNKIDVADVEAEIAALREEAAKINEKIDRLRKIRWRLTNMMVPDWKERIAKKKNSGEQPEQTEQTEQTD